jgi:glycosyltransferase involved in cell wall biosynthesis
VLFGIPIATFESKRSIEMNQYGETLTQPHGIVVIGNYLPRKCGIATFTTDLSEAIASAAGREQPVSVIAMNDKPDAYDYPDRVRFEIRQEFHGDYSRAADFLNFGAADVVSIQHEFGIYGGVAGANLLTLTRELRRPFAMTCHTVLDQPLKEERAVFEELSSRARKLVVMSEKAVGILKETFGIDGEKIALIPHGIHDVPFVDSSFWKDKFGMEGKRVLLSFGLLSRNKGIETVIAALPGIIEKHPKVIYVVLGATHPGVVKLEGESYRLALQRQARDLGVEGHVHFIPRFVELDELLEYIGATDILVTPYQNMAQITSGVLSYAMGAGKAVVSTPYWHAEELLADGRGRLFPVGDSDNLARQVIELLDDEVVLSAMRKRAYLYCRQMVWASVAKHYLGLFDEIRSHSPKVGQVSLPVSAPLSPADLPVPRMDHLIRLSDDTGFCHHAIRKLPDWRHGYWLEDTATALVVASKFYDLLNVPMAAEMTEKSLRLIQFMVNRDVPVGRLDYTRQPKDPATEQELGRVIWAVGYAVSHGPEFSMEYAIDLFNLLVPDSLLKAPSACAYAVLGAANYLKRFSGASFVRKYLNQNIESLITRIEASDWLEWWDGPHLGILPQALAVAAKMQQSETIGQIARKQVEQLIAITAGGERFLKQINNPDEEELPIFAMTFIEALGALYHLTGDKTLFGPMRRAANWFMGDNVRGEAVYNFASGGCHDALTAGGLNQNLGTEASLHCIISFLTLHEFIGTPAANEKK